MGAAIGLRNDPVGFVLDLDDQDIDDTGAVHIAEALQKNTVGFLSHETSDASIQYNLQTLKALSLRRNRIGTSGAQHLANAVRYNKVALQCLFILNRHVFHLYVDLAQTGFEGEHRGLSCCRWSGARTAEQSGNWRVHSKLRCHHRSLRVDDRCARSSWTRDRSPRSRTSRRRLTTQSSKFQLTSILSL